MVKILLLSALVCFSTFSFAAVLRDITAKYLTEAESECDEISEAFKNQNSEFNFFIQSRSRATPSFVIAEKTFEASLSSNTSNLLCLKGQFCVDGLKNIRFPPRSPTIVKNDQQNNENQKPDTTEPKPEEDKVLKGSLSQHEAYAVKAIIRGDSNLLQDVIKSARRKFPNVSLISRWIENEFDEDEEESEKMYTLLHYCVIHDNIDAFVWLLNDAHANPNIKDEYGTSLVQFIFDYSCSKEERFTYANLAIEYGATVTKRMVILCIRHNLQNVLYTIHMNYRKINDFLGDEAMEVALQYGNPGMVKFLRRIGCQ